MSDIALLERLIETWRAKWLLEEDTLPEAICGEHPELLDEFQRRINEIKLVDQLVGEYEELRASGEEPSAESVCRRHPELIERFKAEINKLDRFDSAFSDADETDEPGGEVVGQFCDGRYKVDRVLNRGGQGIIYTANDQELGRTVVVKGPGRRGLGREALGRLELEAFTTGRLEHPGVVPVYGFGRDQTGKPYCAMKFIDGETLIAAIRRFHEPPALAGESSQRTLDFQKLLRNFVQVCQTIAFAHSRGVVHRDIKPANIMLGKFGEVWVVDWGLAKRLNEGPHNSDSSVGPPPLPDSSWKEQLLSQTDSIKGTLAYMSPEQAAGRNREVGPASDVYSLGATLYELLTGRPPVQGDSPAQVLQHVIAGHIVPPRHVNPSVPPALEAICLKAMSLRSVERYANANELADDIQRWLADEPVSASRDPWKVRARRWARRHRSLVTAAAAAVLVGVIALSATSALLANKKQLLEVANDNTTNALNDANQQKKQAQEAQKAERERADELARALYRNQFLLAAAAFKEMDVKRAEAILDGCDQRLRSFEWHHLKKLCQAPRELLKDQYRYIENLAVSADGAFLAVLGSVPSKSGDSVVRQASLVDLATGKSVRTFSWPGTGLAQDTKRIFAFSPDGKRFAVATEDDKQVTVIDPRENKVIHRFPGQALGVNDSKLWLHFSQDSTRLAVISGVRDKASDSIMTVRVWNMVSGAKLSEWTYQGDIFGASFLDEGRKFVIAHQKWINKPAPNGPQVTLVEFRIWDTATGMPAGANDGPELPFWGDHGVSFSADGRHAWIATASHPRLPAGPLRETVFDSTTGKVAYTLVGPKFHVDEQVSPVANLQFSPYARRFATAGSDRTIRIWDADTGSLLFVLVGHTSTPRLMAFSPDGKTLASYGNDRAIRIWNLEAGGKQMKVVPARDEYVTGLQFLPGGAGFVSVGFDGVARVWDLAPAGVAELPGGVGKRGAFKIASGALAGSSDGVLAAMQLDGFARMWNLPKYQRQLEAPFNTGKGETQFATYHPDIALSPDGSKYVVAGFNEARVLDAKTNKELCLIAGVDGPAVFTRDGKSVVVIRRSRNMVDVFQQEKLITLVKDDRARRTLARFDDEKTKIDDFFLMSLLKEEKDLVELLKKKAIAAIYLADATTGRIQASFGDVTRCLAVHPAGDWLAAGEWDGDVSIYSLSELAKQGADAANVKPIKTFSTGRGMVTSVSFSPNGRWLVITKGENNVEVWDVKTWSRHVELAGHTEMVNCAAFSSDGARLATGSADKTVRLWDTDTWQLLWTFDQPQMNVISLAFSPDDRRLFGAGRGGSVYFGTDVGEIYIWGDGEIK